MQIRYYVFKPMDDAVCVKSYSPITDSFERDSDSEFCFEYSF